MRQEDGWAPELDGEEKNVYSCQKLKPKSSDFQYIT
jgi:hypothetical protein